MKCFCRRFSFLIISKTVGSASERWAPRSFCWLSLDMARHSDERVLGAMGRLQALQVREAKGFDVDLKEAITAVGGCLEDGRGNSLVRLV